MKALVLGGTGFIGNNLARRLAHGGDQVGLLVRKESKNWRISDLSGEVDFLEGDLTEKNSLTRLIQDYSPDFVYNFGTYGVRPQFQKDEDAMVSVNVEGTLNLLEAIGEIPLINVGSSSEYGTKSSSMKETDRCRPNNRYGQTKLIQTLYCSEQGIPTLRLSSVYGPWEDSTRLIPTLIRSKLTGDRLNLVNSVRDYIYVDDVVEAVFKATERYDEIKGEIINVGSGQQYSMKDILGELDKVDSRRLNISWNFESAQAEPFVWVTDISKAKRVLGWNPEISFAQGLKKTYEWYKNEEFLQ